MKKFTSLFTKCENPTDKKQREECAKIEKEKREYFKKQDELRYKNLLKTKGYTDSKLSKMSHGDLSNLYDLHAKIIPKHKKQIARDRELDNQMDIIQYKDSEQRRLENNARKYLKSINEKVPSHLSGKEIQDIADLRYRLRRLKDIPETKIDSEFKISKLPKPPTNKPVTRTRKGGKKKKRKTKKTLKKRRKTAKKNHGKDKRKTRR